MEPGVKAVRPWSRAGARYAGPPWPRSARTTRGHSIVRDGRAHYDPSPGEDTLDTAFWDRLIADAAGVFTAPGFGERSLTPVLESAELLRRARGAALSRVKRHTWRPLLLRAIAASLRALAAGVPLTASSVAPSAVSAGAPTGAERDSLGLDSLGIDVPAFEAWCMAEPDTVREALRSLWRDNTLSPANNVGGFLESVPFDAVPLPGRLSLASLLLGAVDPALYPVFQPDVASTLVSRPSTAVPETAQQDTRQVTSAVDQDPTAHYRAFLTLLDQVVHEAGKRGLALSHRLHAAAVLRALAPRPVPAPAPSPARHKASRQSRRQPDKVLREHSGPPSFAELARELFLDQGALDKIALLLEDRRQCVFFGPPGTGKTYVARRLARTLAGGDSRVHLVQLHPSYAYEDFVEGYRPVTTTSASAALGAKSDADMSASPGSPVAPGFALVDGPLKRAAAAAHANPGQTHVLVIDEMNRGNVARVFGELYYLLEYRDASITLQYSHAPFSLPRNLLVIATMNTADRSIALVDQALRRRFYFVPFFPDEPPIQGLLTRWLTVYNPDLLWVADAVDRANALLNDRNAAIGPSHFLRSDLTEGWVELIWEHSILPAIAEHVGDDPDTLAQFRLARLRRTQRPAAPSRARRALRAHEPDLMPAALHEPLAHEVTRTLEDAIGRPARKRKPSTARDAYAPSDAG